MTHKLARIWAPIAAAATLLAGTASAGGPACSNCSGSPNCPGSACCTARKTPYLDGRVQFGYFSTNWHIPRRSYPLH
jgi:hypothetical protein